MSNAKTKKLEDMNEKERKEYNDQKLEERKTPEFFKNTAAKRVNKAIGALNTVGHMGKYNGTKEEFESIITAIDTAVEGMKDKLLKKVNAKKEFTL